MKPLYIFVHKYVIVDKDRTVILKGTPKEQWLIPIDDEKDRKRIVYYYSKAIAENMLSGGYYRNNRNPNNNFKHYELEVVPIDLTIKEIIDMGNDIKQNTRMLVVQVITSSSLDTIIQRVYGREFNFQDDMEISSDQCKLYTSMDGKPSIDDVEDIVKFQETGYHCFLTCRLINDLVRRGELPAGNILVQCI